MKPAKKRSLRTKLALQAAQAAHFWSKFLHLGQGEMINGLIGLKIAPDLIQTLTADKKIVLVTGTNGKSTTTRMIADILATRYSVATQKNGANMDAGIAAALMANPRAQIAVLEVDEMHLEHIAAITNPAVLVILNISRDQLDRVGELSVIGKTIAKTVQKQTQATVIANCDNVLATYAAKDAAHPVWVAAGTEWHYDSTLEPTTGEKIIFTKDGSHWHNASNTFQKPIANWSHVGNDITGPHNYKGKFALQIPGHFNIGNALHAIAVADIFNIPPDEAIKTVNNVTEIAGRYKIFNFQAKKIMLLLVKNPAGWHSSINTILENLKPNQSTEIIIGINGQIADGQDLSWLWDVHFEQLAPYQIVATGDRGTDLAVRLYYAEIPYRYTPDLINTVNDSTAKEIIVLANYTAFRDLLTYLEEETQHG